MPTHNRHDDKRDPRLPGEDGLTRAYHGGTRAEPAATLDRAILDQARAAVGQTRGGRMRWALPLTTAAVVVLSLSVVLQLSQRGEPELDQIAATPATIPPPPPTPKAVPLQKRAAAETAAPSAPAEPLADARLAERLDAKPVTPAAAPARHSRARDGGGEASLSKEETRVTALASGALAPNAGSAADILAIDVSGKPGAYELSVTVRSPDTGCEQYADWWEVVSLDGRLLYRRVLLHSHSGEQPFTRAGGPVPISADTTVWIRAHMNRGGYGGAAMKGSVQSGFARVLLTRDFAAHLATQPPLPAGCDF